MSDKWKAIQKWAGVKDDGDPGPKTADAIIAKAGIKVTPAPAPSSLVSGIGKSISRIVIHCTATREGQAVTASTIRKWHTTPVAQGGRGWSDIGYHFVIGLDGTVEKGRAENVAGAHVAGFNTGSIGIVYAGGLDAQGKAKDTRTTAQVQSMARLVGDLTRAYPGAKVMGHRDLSPDRNKDGVISPSEWLKDCPCFDAAAWWNGVK